MTRPSAAGKIIIYSGTNHDNVIVKRGEYRRHRQHQQAARRSLKVTHFICRPVQKQRLPCCGWDLCPSPVAIGTAVGIIAAQSIGEHRYAIWRACDSLGSVAWASTVSESCRPSVLYSTSLAASCRRCTQAAGDTAPPGHLSLAGSPVRPRWPTPPTTAVYRGASRIRALHARHRGGCEVRARQHRSPRTVNFRSLLQAHGYQRHHARSSGNVRTSTPSGRRFGCF